jgi:hypothetical protein
MAVPLNIGSKRSPVNLGHGVLAFKRNGHWHYRDAEAKSHKFKEATDGELVFELEKRGLAVLYPGHECVDHPNLPCPACERVALRAIGLCG